MGSEENAALVRRGYEAFSTGDMATLTEVIAEDAVWHEEGHGGVSGVNRGRDAVGGDGRVIALHHDHAERDNKVLDQNVVVIFHVRDGRISEVWEIPDDQAGRGEFFS